MNCGTAAKIAAAMDVIVYDSPPAPRCLCGDLHGAKARQRDEQRRNCRSGCTHSNGLRLSELAPTEMVIGAILESLPAKREFRRRLEEIVPPETMIASRTSGFTPAAPFGGMRLSGRFLVAHSGTGHI